MNIITAPHEGLRETAEEIEAINDQTKPVLKNIGLVLEKTSTRGVGLAATQLNQAWQVFATYLTDRGEDEGNRHIQLYINPRITKTFGKLSLDSGNSHPTGTPLEGCLSIPGLFGPVPRYEKIRLEFEKIKDGKLVSTQQELDGFPARLAQHELDHLHGILFTDYILEYDLPIYTENKQTQELEELTDRSIIEIF